MVRPTAEGDVADGGVDYQLTAARAPPRPFAAVLRGTPPTLAWPKFAAFRGPRSVGYLRGAAEGVHPKSEEARPRICLGSDEHRRGTLVSRSLRFSRAFRRSLVLVCDADTFQVFC